MYKLSIVFILLLLLASSSLGGTIKAEQFESPVLNRSWSYTVYLPDGYDTSETKYQVLYLLHGNGDDEYQWSKRVKIEAILDSLIKSEKIPPVIVITPSAGTSWYVDGNEKIESAFIKDLIPEIDKQFRTIAGREGRVIAGFSMGGYGALRFALIYPEMFCSAGLISPAIYREEPPETSAARKSGAFGEPFDPEIWKSLNYPAYFDKFKEKQLPLFFYIVAGDNDRLNTEIEGTFLYEKLKENNQPSELRIYDGNHDWIFVTSIIEEVLENILSGKKI